MIRMAFSRRAVITVGFIALGFGFIAVFSKSLLAFPAQLFATSIPTATIPLTPTGTPTTAPTATPTFIFSTIMPTPDQRILDPANGHLYLYVEQNMRWPDATSYCVSRGGHLVTIQDDAENTFIFKLTGGNIWLGASRDANGGAWHWVTGEPFKFIKWGGYPPTSNDQIYVYLSPDVIKRVPMTWDASTSSEIFLVVCEWESASP